MDQMVRVRTLDPKVLRGMLSVIDTVKGGRGLDLTTVQEVSLELDRFIPKNSGHLSECDPSILDIIREAIIENPVPWFKVPRRTVLSDQNVWDFLRSVRKKSWSVRQLEARAQDGLRSIFLFLTERLPEA